MADLAEFLGKKKKQEVEVKGQEVQGSFACMECNKVSQNAKLDYEEKVLIWSCLECENLNRVVINV